MRVCFGFGAIGGGGGIMDRCRFASSAAAAFCLAASAAAFFWRIAAALAFTSLRSTRPALRFMADPLVLVQCPINAKRHRYVRVDLERRLQSMGPNSAGAASVAFLNSERGVVWIQMSPLRAAACK